MTRFIDVWNDTKEVKKETVFNFVQTQSGGWKKTNAEPKDYKTVKYLGKCSMDGDMFMAYNTDVILIYKGTKGDEFNQ